MFLHNDLYPVDEGTRDAVGGVQVGAVGVHGDVAVSGNVPLQYHVSAGGGETVILAWDQSVHQRIAILDAN